jgi:hypothetical protein
MTSPNVEILRKGRPASAGLSAFADAYVNIDPCSEGPAPNPGEPTQ